MNEKYTSIIPNSTQVPQVIIREWMPRLKDVEFRVLMVIVDQTLGWIENTETGMRKEEDWISQSQLVKKTGRSRKSISTALKILIDKYSIIEARNESGRQLDTPDLRMSCGDKIFYRLALKSPQLSLFDVRKKKAWGVVKFAGVCRHIDKQDKNIGNQVPLQNLRAQNLRTTKETLKNKRNTCESGIHEAEKDSPKPKKEIGPHTQFIKWWYETVQATRGIKPVITAADGKNLKRILDLNIFSPPQLQQLALYFLGNYQFTQFNPSISTFLSAGVLNGLQNKMQNRPEFWKEIDQLTMRYIPQITVSNSQGGSGDMADKLAKLRSSLSEKFNFKMSPTEVAMQ